MEMAIRIGRRRDAESARGFAALETVVSFPTCRPLWKWRVSSCSSFTFLEQEPDMRKLHVVKLQSEER
ncbi:MAG TPA: hypothetical protein VHG91_18505, partial [Longimicrobium sp.]|nr:hypothetical protein [Longimicrobium sp.]